MKILNFPERRQTYNYDCWASCAQSVLNYYWIDIREDTIMKIAWTNKEWTSIWWIEMVVHKYKLKNKTEHMTISKIKKYIDRQIPVIIILQARTDTKHVDWKSNRVDGHYVVAIGYDKTKIYFEDPSSIYRTYLLNNEFKERRHDVDIDWREYYHYGIAVYGKKPKYSTHTKIHMD